MWLTRLKLRHADCPIVRRCEKFHVIISSYPGSHYTKKGSVYATTTCHFQSADDTVKKKFLKDLKADTRLTHLEVSGDIFTYEINLGKHGEHVMLYHTQNIFFAKPVINHYDGHEYWEVASWEKKELQQFIADLKKHMDVCTILSMKQSPLTDIYFPNVMPKVSKKQKNALDLALAEGYYSYPRKITLEQLAKLSKVGLSTFQEHLRKGELKILPVIIEHQLTNAEETRRSTVKRI